MKLYWKGPDVNRSPRKIQSYCLLAILVFHGITAYPADVPLLERTITITLKQERIDTALKRIAEQGGFVFSYNPAIIDVGKTITFTFRNKTVREILDEIFDGKIDYKQRKQYVILTKNSANGGHVVSGYVTDDKTGERLKNVTLYEATTLTSTVTDDYGFFKLKVNKPDAIITVNRTQYADTIVAIPNRIGLLRIRIKNRTDRIGTLTDTLRHKITRLWKVKILKQQDINLLNVRDTLYRKAQVSLFPFIGTNHALSGNVINDYSFNIFGGYSMGVRKLELGGIFNTVRGNVEGLQIGAYFNGVYGKRKGVQLSGGVNANYDSSAGVQLAGSCNINWKSTQGISAAGLVNLTHGYARSTSLAGLSNFTLGEQRGIHIAGLFNFSSGNAAPLQISGLTNVALHDMRGVQFSGLMNLTGKQMRGAQISGLLNYATSVHAMIMYSLLSPSINVRK